MEENNDGTNDLIIQGAFTLILSSVSLMFSVYILLDLIIKKKTKSLESSETTFWIYIYLFVICAINAIGYLIPPKSIDTLCHAQRFFIISGQFGVLTSLYNFQIELSYGISKRNLSYKKTIILLIHSLILTFSIPIVYTISTKNEKVDDGFYCSFLVLENDKFYTLEVCHFINAFYFLINIVLFVYLLTKGLKISDKNQRRQFIKLIMKFISVAFIYNIISLCYFFVLEKNNSQNILKKVMYPLKHITQCLSYLMFIITLLPKDVFMKKEKLLELDDVSAGRLFD
jgi:hypothetical protein